MGHKVHPVGFRLGFIAEWQAKWFASKPRIYRALVNEDMQIRTAIAKRYADAGIARVDIERSSNDAVVTIHTARPGIVIGRGGQRVEELRQLLEKQISGKKVRLNIQEIRQPELDAYLVARNVADQMEKRISYRRAIKQAVARSMQAGAKGAKIQVSGRLGGAEIARVEKESEGKVPLHTLRADIGYATATAQTVMGKVGVKVWIYKGEILPEREEPLGEVMPTVAAAPVAPVGAGSQPARPDEVKAEVKAEP